MRAYFNLPKRTVTIWNGNENVQVLGTLHSAGFQGGSEEILLFRAYNRCKKRWWLYYSDAQLTGGFKTRQEAIKFRLNGGK